MVKKKDNTVQGIENDLEPENDTVLGTNVWNVYDKRVPYMEYSEQLGGKFRCTKCKIEFSGKPNASRHLYSLKSHGVNWDGTPIGEEPPKTENKEDDNEPVEDQPSPSERKLMEAWGETVPEQEAKETGEDAFDIHKREKAQAIARVMENPYITMFFVEARRFKLFPPTFDEGDMIRTALEYFGKHIGFSINVGHDPRIVVDPDLQRMLKASFRAWDNWNEGEEDG